MNEKGANLPQQAALSVLHTLAGRGFTALFAGGCVRDMLLGRRPVDYDVATDARPEQIRALFPRTIEVGAAFGVVRVVVDGLPVEVATFRKDVGIEDGRHPTAVVFATAEEDAQRRDFTVNGLFFSPQDDRVIDYVNGRADIDAGVIRAIGNPAERFREDYLRMIRAVRFAAVLDFRIEPETAAAIREQASGIASISAERIRQELVRILTEAPRAGDALRLLQHLDLLKIILPEAAAMKGQEQPEAFHPEGDVFTHTAQMLNAMDNPTPILAMAVLLHDIGKPPTAETVATQDGGERIRFYGHASVGAEVAERIMRRLRFSRREINAVSTCVRNHMRFMHADEMRESKLRTWAATPEFPTEMELHRLDCLCSHGSMDQHEYLQAFLSKLDAEPKLPEPWISGHDILALGVPEGPEVGRWHHLAFEAQLEHRFPDRDKLLQWLRQRVRESSKVDGER